MHPKGPIERDRIVFDALKLSIQVMDKLFGHNFVVRGTIHGRYKTRKQVILQESEV